MNNMNGELLVETKMVVGECALQHFHVR